MGLTILGEPLGVGHTGANLFKVEKFTVFKIREDRGGRGV